MTFTPEIPTVPGAYRWKPKGLNRLEFYTNERVVCVEQNRFGVLCGCIADSHSHWKPLKDFGGLWSPRLVPVDEVEKAYKEGLCDCGPITRKGVDMAYASSRAKQVVEGKERP